MADIELVIRIDEEDYRIMKHNIAVNNPLCPLSQEEMVYKVANGTPLPKGHGDLKDADKLRDAFIKLYEAIQGNFTFADVASVVCNTLPIIEADKGGEQE